MKRNAWGIVRKSWLETAAVGAKSALAVVFAVGMFTAASAMDDLFAPAESAPAAPAAETGGGFDIESMFGTFEASQPQAEVAAPVRVLPPFEGNYRVLVTRPMYAVFEQEQGTKWVSAIGELHTHYKIASFPRTHVLSMEQVNNVLPTSRDYSRRISRQHYIDAARRLGATHVILQEYVPERGRNVRSTNYAMELFWIDSAATVARATGAVAFNNFEADLNALLVQIANAMDPGAARTAAMGLTLWPRDQRALETFGNALADEGNFNVPNATAAYEAIERTVNHRNNAGMIGFQYGAALVAGRAERYDRALTHFQTVVSRSGDYPALQLRLAQFLRGAGQFADALRAAETASRTPALNTPALIEIAMTHQAQGNLDQALSGYNAIVTAGNADSRVFFQLALLSVQMNRLSESDSYLGRAEQGGFTIDDGQLFDLGEAYSKIPGQEAKAIDFLRRSMGMQMNNPEAWRLIAELHQRTGAEEQRADAYVNMFRINMHGNSGRLKTAGEIYERLGLVEKAKDAYSLFLDRRFADTELSMNLARIYFNEKNCRRLPDVLRGLDTIPEAAEMLTACGIRVRRVDADQALQTRRLSPAMLALRISGATLLAGGITGGVLMNMSAESTLEDYRKFNEPVNLDNPDDWHTYEGVKKLRDDIDSAVMIRNILYGVAGAGLAAFALTFFF